MVVEVRGMKTWSKLAKNKRRPSEYEIVSTNLQTRVRHRDQAYELSPAPDLAMNEWYRKNVFDSPLRSDDWEEFRDPDQLIYRIYTRNQDVQEDYIDGLLDDHNEIEHDKGLRPEWLDCLESQYTPRRYVQSALQMCAAYLLQIAPASTLVTAAGFQEGDEFRWLSRVAYRTRELQLTHGERGFAKNERKHWEQGLAFQGLRELLEKVLITYDWGEAFVALNLIAKPAADETLRELGLAARHSDDHLTALLVDNQMRDSDRSRRWSAAVVEFCADQHDNNAVIHGWIEKWMPLAKQAISTYCAALPDGEASASAACKRIEAFHRSLAISA